MMTKPISPMECAAKKLEAIPDAVIEAFNTLIAARFDGRESGFRQSEIVEAITKAMCIPIAEVFQKGYLDVEEVYRKAGWIVKYDSPGFNETFSPYYRFKANDPKWTAEPSKRVMGA